MKRLIDSGVIQARLAELGRQIARDYQDRPLTVLGVLTGSMILVSDLVRSIDLPLRLGMIHASSYRGKATVPGTVSLDLSLLPDLRGRHVLVVDDIFDTGRTLAAVIEQVRTAEPAGVAAAVLLWKERHRESSWEPEYVGFKIPDVFVVGYGLDYNDEHRSLPYVAALEEEDL